MKRRNRVQLFGPVLRETFEESQSVGSGELAACMYGIIDAFVQVQLEILRRASIQFFLRFQHARVEKLESSTPLLERVSACTGRSNELEKRVHSWTT